MLYFAETHTQTTYHKVKVALVVSVDLNNLGKCQQEFCCVSILLGMLPHFMLAMMMVLMLPLQLLLIGAFQHQFVFDLF